MMDSILSFLGAGVAGVIAGGVTLWALASAFMRGPDGWAAGFPVLVLSVLVGFAVFGGLLIWG